MANVKQGNLTPPPQWWKHLKEFKRVFWKAERKAQREAVKNEAADTLMLTQCDFVAFASSVETPPNPNAALRKLMARK
ncbi:MAG: DUF1778 domain-containing protein [Pseudomonadota bacterium]